MAVSENNGPINKRGLGVYIHWPFCASKCPYCDFNSHVSDAIDHDRWRKALLAELSYFADETNGRAVTSVFFGGGTPSLMDPETAAALIDAVKGHWTTGDGLEVTLEANPSTAEAGRFRDFRAAGVNRLSIGVQSFDDEALRFLGRGHSAIEAKDAVALAAETFPRFSFDLIYGLPGALPGQSGDDWKRDLDRGIALAVETGGGHLSLYQLTVEPGTPFYRGGIAAAGEDIGAALYAITQEKMDQAGLPAYEISNHARPGFECRHNLDIWRGGDYAGVGPGAHGRLTNKSGTESLYQIHTPERWLAAVEAGGHATAKRQPLTPGERAEEILMSGLRLGGGIERESLAALEPVIDPVGLKRMIDGGFVESDGGGLRATLSGRLCLNEVLRQLLSGP